MNLNGDKGALVTYAIRLGDDALILGQRISEWVSNGPFLEEDIAYGNVALDFLGRARMFYGYAGELAADGRGEDDFAYRRNEREFTNLLIHELPRGDFAFSQVRQLFIDLYNTAFLERLAKSRDPRLAGIAAKAVKETRYHLRRSREWVLRLGDGTEESHGRAQRAVDELWGYTHELFDTDSLERRLAEEGVGVDNSSLRGGWLIGVHSILEQATLQVPEDGWAVRGGRQGYHTESLGHLLTELQYIHRCYPGCSW